MNNIEGKKLKCPYNNFVDCFDFKCPFYYRQWQIVDMRTGRKGFVSHCKRAEKELNN